MPPRPLPLRILHCHSTFSLGGKEARAVRLMNRFADRARHVVLSAVPDQTGARSAIDPAVECAFPGSDAAPALHGRPGPRRYVALAGFMQAFDLVLTYNWGAMDAVMAHRLLSPVMRLPPLIHHEDGFNADESERLDWRRNGFRRVALKAARAVVVPSMSLERIASTIWRCERTVRISNGIAVTDYDRPPQAGGIPGLRPDPAMVTVGTIAGLRAVKDLPLLVHAIAQTPPHVRLVIVGEGPERDAIAATAAALGIADRVMLAGFIPDPSNYVGLFDILALSSQSEQQPIAVMEGMAAGLPVVAPAVGDIAHMVAAANADFIVGRTATALAGAIVTLADDPDRRLAIGRANAMAARERFDQQAMISAYAELYAGAMGLPASALLDRA